MIYPPRRAQRTQSFRTVSIVADFPDGSAFSVCSAVKFKDMAISLENLTVPLLYSLKSNEIIMATTITIKGEAIPIVKSGLAIEENILKI